MLVLQLKEIFSKIDTNKDSLISPEEVTAASLQEYEQELMEIFPPGNEEDDNDDDEDVQGSEEEADKEDNIGRREDL